MTPDDGSAQNNLWPLPKFYFHVDFGDNFKGVAFQEVSGLDTEEQIIKYRTGDSKMFSNIKMPGLIKTSSVTLKKGIFSGDDNFWDWYNQIKMNTIKRQTVIIKLLDEDGNPTMVWELANAWPTKITGTDLKSDENEVAIETIEIAHEGLTIKNG